MYFLFKGIMDSLKGQIRMRYVCITETTYILCENNFNKIRRLIVLNLYDLNYLRDEIGKCRIFLLTVIFILQNQ